jgi:signal peptidase II
MNIFNKEVNLFYFFFFLVLLIDQSLKYFIRYNLQLGEGVWIIKDFFSICYIQNPGIAFGLLKSFKDIFLYLNLLLVGVIIAIYKRLKKEGKKIDLVFGLILGGALSNIIDRIMFKAVIDFLDIGYKKFRWPAFNLADLSICIGMIILLFHILSQSRKKAF